MAIKIKAVQHIAIALEKSDPFLQSLKELFDIEAEGQEVVQEQKVRTDFFKIGNVPFELLEATAEDSPITNFLKKRGNAFHHLALEVENIEEAVQFLKSKNIRLIDEVPRKGAHGTKTVFLHPKAFHGILIELVEC